FYSHLTMTLRSNKGGHVYFNPLYPNFPQQVMEASDAELYMNSLLYYISGGELFPEYEKEARGEFVDNPKDADTVFSVDKGITPFDTDVIMAQYL
ncbi:hypothetical protein PJM52_29030, partial [Mycobacterium kansasii]